MKILLIQPSGKLRSLALLKLARYHKNKGDDVGFNISDPDLIYVSIIFDKDKWVANSLKFKYPNTKIIVGGPGYDPKICLDSEVEKIKPLWELLPEQEYSYGYITRGCTRKCYFCKVPNMGKPHFVSWPWEWHEKGHCRILDDNITLFPDVLEKSAEWFNENNIVVDFENFDARLIDLKTAKIIKSMKHKQRVRISYDISENEKEIKKGYDNLVEVGIKPSFIQVYIYCHSGKYCDRKDASHRFKQARSWGADVFLMVNLDKKLTKKRRTMRRKGIAPPIWRTTSIEEIFRLDLKGEI